MTCWWRATSHLEAILNTFMVAVSLAVAAIPEGLATVVTVVLSIGVTNMSQAQRRDPPADGGGDPGLHPGHLLRQDRHPDPEQDDRGGPHGPDERLLATAMALCSDAAWTERRRRQGEPTEAALVNFAAEHRAEQARAGGGAAPGGRGPL